jgi:amino acid adenylation domain-containing protein
VALRLKGRLNIAALEQSLNQVIRRHESLRTTFKLAGDQTLQFVGPAFRLDLSPQHVPPSSTISREQQIADRATRELQRVFDLTAGPLMTAALLRFTKADHALLLTMHHIVADGWSIGVFLRELSAFYQSYSRGGEPDVPPLPLQYADFAVWQRQERHQAVLAADLDYWKRQLAGVPPRLELPTDHPRPERTSFRGANIQFLVPGELQERLVKLGQSEGATLFMTLLAALNVLLYRYSGQEDIAVGTPIAQRNRPEIEELIGFFINTLVLRIQLSEKLTFRELLRRAKEVSLGAFTHQDLPFEKLVEELHPQRNLAQSPLFQVMLDLQNAPMELAPIDGLQWSLLPVDAQTAKFDLTLTFSQTGGGLDAALEYSTELFDEVTARRMAANFLTLLESIARHPDTRIDVLPLLTEAEKKLLREWNNTGRDHGPDTEIHRAFEQQSRQAANQIAVVCGNTTLTYQELNRRSNQLARHLLGSGVSPGSLVGICLERSVELPLAVLAALKAGAAYVPLDPAYPKERLAFMMQDAQLRAVVTTAGLLSRLPQTGIETVCLDRDNDSVADQGEENLAGSPWLDGPAYVIYTSGSTGNPKGVVVSHRNLLHSTLERMAYYSQPVDAFLLIPSFSFDSSVAGLFWTLCQGAKLVMPEQGEHSDLSHLAELVERHSVSHVLCLPALYSLLLEQHGKRLASLRITIVAGEPCAPELAELQRRHAPQASLFNEYGPTEATVWSTAYNVGFFQTGSAVPIGRPIGNSKVYILDRCRQLVPVGAPGELYIGGGGVAQGYLNRAELTAQRFVPDPFSGEPGARLYRTGDLGRYRDNGDIEFRGRTDFQVKVRGYRVELTEIEFALAQHPSVQQAVAFLRNNDFTGFVTLKPQQSTTTGELRTYLRNKLPDYMIPGSLRILESVPLTATGKVDRKALALVESPARDHAPEFIAPRTALEQVLAGIFAEVLCIDRIGLDDNFFEMGGHSLMATQVASRVRESLSLDLPVRRIFESPAVGALATAILKDAPGRARIERTAELLLQLSRVSDEQADTLLAQAIGSTQKGQSS